jgi:hypothetical protein
VPGWLSDRGALVARPKERIPTKSPEGPQNNGATDDVHEVKTVKVTKIVFLVLLFLLFVVGSVTY